MMTDAPALAQPAPHSRREQAGWYVYDWANSAFITTVVTVFLGPYITVALAPSSADAQGFLHPLGIPVAVRAYWSFLIAAAACLQVVALPLVAALADYSARKKQMLGACAYLGAAATVAMYWLTGGAYLRAGLLFLVANTAFGASVVLYNSFLPEIASPEDRDRVSSTGWGVGYLGGGLLLALNLLLFLRAEALGLSEGQAVRISLASAGAWWALFTLIPLATLRNRRPARRLERGQSAVAASLRQLWQTLREARRYPQTLTFLLAYLLYNDAIQTVILLAGQFGASELGIQPGPLAGIILMAQFVGFFGALGFNRVAARIGAQRAVMASLVVWAGVALSMYSFVRTTAQFVLMTAVVALVLGGSQALSRSLFSVMIPKGREAEYFSVYEVSEKGTSWLCPLVFGILVQATGSYRTGTLALAGFFLAGLVVLARVDVRRAAREAGNDAA
jgi:UMF1 family MFS transporter